MNKLRLELLAVKYPLWDMARLGPDGLERVTQSDTLADGVQRMLESTLGAEPPERTHVRIVLEINYPEGEAP